MNPFDTRMEIPGTPTDTSGLEALITPPDSPLITGEKNKKIRLARPAKKEKKIPGIRGSIGVNITTGTVISSPSGDIIDPTSIDISTVSDVIQKK